MSHDAMLRHKAGHYQYINEVIKQVTKVTKQYTELRTDVKFFTHNNGAQDNLIQLNGTIPVFYKQRQYNIPICIWLYDKHPVVAPMVYVQPTSTMVIRQGRHVDASGKVYLPYLSDWKSKKSDLVGLVGILCTVFGMEPPVVAKPAGHQPTRPAQPPIRTASYPTQQSYPTHPPSFQSPPSYPAQPAYHPPYPTGHPNVQGPPGGGYIPPGTNPPYPTGGAYPTHPPTTGSGNPPPYPQGGPAYSYSSPQMNSQPFDKNNSIDDSIIMASVRDSVNDTLKRRANDIISQLNGELNTLRVTENELKMGKQKIEEMNGTIEQEKEKCKSSISSYNNQIEEMNHEISNLESGNQIGADEIITPSTPIYKQIFHAHAQEQAIEDAIYFISKALSRGTIDCETFLRYVRRLSRQQFEMKETVIKAREAARI